MKRIGIDARLYSQTGVGTYISNLIRDLQKILPEDYQVYVYLLKQDFDKLDITNKNFVKRVADYKWHTFSEQLGFAKLLYADNLDLMHFTYFSYPIFYRRKFVSTIHDVTPLLFRTGKASTRNKLVYDFKYFFFKIVLKSQASGAEAIITPTVTVKNDLIKFYGHEYEQKITAIYEGVDFNTIKSSENKNLSNKFDYKFFIYVGNFYPHKNVAKLVEAFAKVKGDCKLILIGPNDYFSKSLYQLINQLKQENKIIFYYNPNKSDLVFFYKNAQALIHPSLSEGFGLPLIEAAYFGLPIIASNINVFKEVLANNYLQFDPNNVDDIQDKIVQFIKNKPKFDYRKILGRYSFDEMTRSTWNIYKSLLASK